MKDTQTIKTRLSNIQGYFNPEKTTYKVIEYVVNNDLTYNEMLMELSKIRGFSKYPEGLKNEYISIINDIKENIINQRKQEELERQKANTQELKDIIDSLEKTRIQYIAKQAEEEEEVLEVDDEGEEKEEVVAEQEVKLKKKDVSVVKKEEKDESDDEDKDEIVPKIKKSLIVLIVLVIISMILLVLFY